MAIKTFKMKKGPVPKRITPYMKRVAKSFALASVDVVYELNPTLHSMAKDTKAAAQDVGFKIKDMYGAGTNAVKGLFDPKGDNAVHNLLDSLKTGEWYKRDTFDFGGDEDFNFDDDWGDDDYESSSDSSSSSYSNAASASDVAQVGAEISTNFGKVAASSAEYIVQNNRIASQAIYNVTTNGFSAVNTSLTSINAKIQTLAEMQTPLLTQAQNTFVFQTKASEFFENTNANLEKMVDALEQIKANTAILNANPGNKRSNNKKVTLGSLITGGEFNFAEYFDFIKDNIKERADMLKMFADMGTMMYGKNMKNFSPTSFLMKKGIGALIPNIFKEVLKDVNEQIAASIPLALKQISGKNNRGDYFLKNPILSLIMDIIAPPTTSKTSFNTGNYNKGPVPWDGIARKALVEVIPTYLAKIYASLGGEEKYFDYERGKYVSVVGLKGGKFTGGMQNSIKERIFEEDYEDYYNIVSKDGSSKQKSDIKKWLKNVAYKSDHQEFDPTTLLASLKRAKKGDKVQGMDYETAVLVASVINEYTSTDSNGRAKKNISEQNKFAKALRKILSIPDRYAERLYKEEESGRSLLNIENNDFNEKNKSKWTQMHYLNSIDNKLTKIIDTINASRPIQIDKRGFITYSENIKSFLKNGKNEANNINKEINKNAKNNKSKSLYLKSRSGAFREKTNMDSARFFDDDEYWKLEEELKERNKYSIITGVEYEIRDNKIVKKSDENDLINNTDLSEEDYSSLSTFGKAKYNIKKLKNKIFKRSKKNNLSIWDKMYDVLDKFSLGITQILYGGDDAEGDTIFDRIKNKVKKDFINKIKENFLNPVKDEFDLIKNFAANKFAGVRAGFELMNSDLNPSSDAYFKAYNKKVYKYQNKNNLLLWARQNRLDKSVIRAIKNGKVTTKSEAEEAQKKAEEERLKRNEADIEPFARGGMVTKSGLISVSKGEIVIPSDYNPRYYGSNNKLNQLNTERRYVNNFYGMYANGDLDGVGEDNKPNIVNNTKATIKGIKKAKGKYKTVKGKTDNMRRAIEDTVDSTNAVINSALKSGDKLAAQIGIVSKGAFNIVTGGIVDFISAITGDFEQENIQKVKKSIFEKASDIFGEMKNNKGAMGVGAIAGTGMSILTGAVVGPIAGAAIGAGAGLIFKSEKVQDILFGERAGDKDYENSTRKKIKDFIQSESSKDTLFGAAVGSALGLFTGSPLIGALVGGATGFVASSENAQKWLFGSVDKEGRHTKLLGRVFDRIKANIPATVAGASIGALLGIGGPFGLVGSLVIGGALGNLATTERFRTYMFGEDGTGKDEKSFTGLIRTKIINNVDEIAHNALNMIKGIGRRLAARISVLGDTIKNWFAKGIEKLQTIPALGKLLTIPGKIAKAPIHIAGGVLGVVNKGLQRRNIRHGDEVYDRELKRNLNAQERLNKFGLNYRDATFDSYLSQASYEQMDVMKNNLESIKNSKQAAKYALINNANVYFNRIKSTLSSKVLSQNAKTLNAMYKALKNGDVNNVTKSFNRLQESTRVSAETEKLVREAIEKTTELSDNNNALNNAKNALKSMGINVNKSSRIATYLNRISSEMALTEKGEGSEIDENAAKSDQMTAFQGYVENRLDTIVDALKLMAGVPADKVTKESESNKRIRLAQFEDYQSFRKQGFDAKTAKAKVDEEFRYRDTEFGVVKMHKNAQGEWEDVKNDSNTDKVTKDIDEFKKSINTLPTISNKLGIFGSLFGKFKDFFMGNKEEKKSGLFDKLFGEEGFFTSMKNKLFDFLGIGAGTTIGTILKGALTNLLPIATLTAAFSGALDKFGEWMGDHFPILKDNDTQSTLTDRTSTTVTTKDGSFSNVVTDSKGNPEVTVQNGAAYYTSTTGELIPVDDVVETRSSDVNNSISSRMKTNLFSGSSVGLTLATGSLKYLGVGGKTYNKLFGKAFTKATTGIESGIASLAAKKKAKTYALYKAAKAAGSNAVDAAAYAKRNATLVGKITGKVSDIMKKVGGFLGKKFPKGAKLATKVADGLNDFITKSAEKIAAKLGIKTAGNSAKVIPIAGWIIYGADIVGSAADAWGNAESILGIVDEATTEQRVIATIIGALNAAIPIVGNLIPNNVIVNIIITAGNALGIDFGKLEDQRSAANDIVTKYNEETGSQLSIEEYNQLGINYNAETGEFTQGKARAGWKYKAKTKMKQAWNSFKEFSSELGENIKNSNIVKGLKFIMDLDKTLIQQYVIKGDVKGLWQYNPVKDDDEDEMNGFEKAIVNIAKVYNTPRTIMVKYGLGLKKVIDKVVNTVVGNYKIGSDMADMMYESENISDFISKFKEDISQNDNGDETGVNNFMKAGRVVRRLWTLPIALIKFAGMKIGDKISETVSKIGPRINAFKDSQKDIFNFVSNGDLKGFITYGFNTSGHSGGGGNTDKESEIGPLTKAVLGMERVLLFPVVLTSSVFHGWKNIFDTISNEIGGDVTSLTDDFNKMGQYAAEGKVNDVIAINSEKKSKISGVFDVIEVFGRVFYTLGAVFNKVIQPIKDFFSPIDDTVTSWGVGVGDSLTKFKEKIGQGWSDFWNGFFGGNSGLLPSGGSSGFVSQLDNKYANKSYAGTTFADKGCGPAVASMAASAMGKNLSVDNAIAKSRRYQNGNGTSINYFRDTLGSTGAKTRYLSGSNMRQEALNSLSRGEKVIMLGRDSGNGSKLNSPFGPNNHYVLATGLDKNGNIRVNDPEARGPRSYNAAKLLNGMRMGVAASGGASGLKTGNVGVTYNANLSSEEMGRQARNNIVNTKSKYASATSYNTLDLPDDVCAKIYSEATSSSEAKKIAEDMGANPESAVRYFNTIKKGSNSTSKTEGDMPLTNPERVWAYFASKGLPAEAIAGILGNMKRESEVDPERVQGDHSNDLAYSKDYTGQVDSGKLSRDDFVHRGPNGNGYGLVQFTYHTWKEMLYDSAKRKNISIGDLRNQVENVYEQASGAINKIKNATSPEQASYDFLRGYMNPQCDDAVDIRKANARYFYDLYKDKTFRWDGINYTAKTNGGGEYYDGTDSSSSGEKHTIFNLISRLGSIFSSFGQNQDDDSDNYDPNSTASTSGSTSATGIGGSTVQGSMANNFPYFNQADSPWGSQAYGSHGTVKSSGCGPTSMAMVLKSYGINTDPGQTAKWSADHGHRASNGTAWTFFDAIGRENGLNVEQVDKGGNAAIVSALKNKYPVVASMAPGNFTNGGHFIVLSGLDGDNILVNDPGKRDRTKAWTPADGVLNQAKQFWVVSDSNGIGSIGGYTGNVGKATGRDIPDWQKAEYQQQNYSSGVARDTSASGSGLPSGGGNGVSADAVNALLESIAGLLENVSGNSDYISKIYGVLTKYLGDENDTNKSTGSPKTSYRPTKAKELGTNLIELSAALANIAKG